MSKSKVKHEWSGCSWGFGIYGQGVIRDDRKYVIKETYRDWSTKEYVVYKIDRRNGKQKFVARYSDMEKAKQAYSEVA